MSSDNDLKQAKSDLRIQIRRALKEMPDELRVAESAAIAQHVIASSTFKNANRIALYLSTPKLREVETHSLVDHALAQPHTRLFLPKVDDKYATPPHPTPPTHPHVPRIALPCRAIHPPFGSRHHRQQKSTRPSALRRESHMRMLHVTSLSDVVSSPPYGILEPNETYRAPPPDSEATPREEAASGPLDLVLMPGLGFDRTGRRLGRGGGYYDAYVSKLLSIAAERGLPRPLLVALAFSPQVVPQVPVGTWDHDVDVLVTSEGATVCSHEGITRWKA